MHDFKSFIIFLIFVKNARHIKVLDLFNGLPQVQLYLKTFLSFLFFIYIYIYLILLLRIYHSILLNSNRQFQVSEFFLPLYFVIFYNSKLVVGRRLVSFYLLIIIMVFILFFLCYITERKKKKLQKRIKKRKKRKGRRPNFLHLIFLLFFALPFFSSLNLSHL